MLVELDVFSGRPNPRWQLTGDEAARLARLLEILEPAKADPSTQPPGLGYRGFRFEDSAGSTWLAYGGFVRSPQAILADPNRSVERLLLEYLPAQYGELQPSIERELGTA